MDCEQRNEGILMERCVEWAQECCKKEGLDPLSIANWRKVLQDFVDHIHLGVDGSAFEVLQCIGLLTRDEIEVIRARKIALR